LRVHLSGATSIISAPFVRLKRRAIEIVQVSIRYLVWTLPYRQFGSLICYALRGRFAIIGLCCYFEIFRTLRLIIIVFGFYRHRTFGVGRWLRFPGALVLDIWVLSLKMRKHIMKRRLISFLPFGIWLRRFVRTIINRCQIYGQELHPRSSF
jgi:hypothetical protein